MNWPKPHFNHVQEFQVSGWPWVTGSSVGTTATVLKFSAVTQWFVVHNESHNKELYFGFTQNGVNDGNRFHICPSGTVGPLNLKCEELWLIASDTNTSYSVIAGLTNVTTGVLQYSASLGMQGVG